MDCRRKCRQRHKLQSDRVGFIAIFEVAPSFFSFVLFFNFLYFLKIKMVQFGFVGFNAISLSVI